MDRSQNGTCNAELSSVMPESRESIQSKITEPGLVCIVFSVYSVSCFLNIIFRLAGG